MAGLVAGDLADPRRRDRAEDLHVVGASPAGTRRRRAGRPGDTAEPDPAGRPDLIPVPVPAPGRPVLLGAVVLVGGARVVGGSDRGAAAAAVDHAAAGRRGRAQGLPER